MSVKIEIHTFDPQGVTGSTDLQRGSEVELGEDVHLRFLGSDHYMQAGIPDLLLFALNVPIGIATGVVAEWLWGYLREKIGNKQVERAVLVIEETDETEYQAGRKTRRNRSRRVELPLDTTTGALIAEALTSRQSADRTTQTGSPVDAQQYGD
jgi:hypothetical protein